MCGIIGIHHHSEAAKLAYLALYAQQHRGQESAGIVTSHDDSFDVHHGMGQVADIFTEPVLATLKGQSAVGHVRYSTHGSSSIKNCQPFSVNFSLGQLAIAHNGNIVNADRIRTQLVKSGAIFRSSSDTEILIHLIARSAHADPVMRVQEALNQIEGAYSLIIMINDIMIAARDPSGFRPLVLGELGDTLLAASETCAFDLIGARHVGEVAPGEMVIWQNKTVRREPIQSLSNKQHCVFEYIYFARPDSQVFGRNVYDIRKGYGVELAKQRPVKADVVVPVPDSGVPAAIGYAQHSGIPFEMGLVRNHYVGRTFIEPSQSIRHFGVKVKLNPIRQVLKDKVVVLVDDSIVRGTTSQKIIKMVRDAGAREIHMRISSPPTSWPCFYGIDTPSRAELISSSKNVAEICSFIQADSLEYLSTDSLFWFAPDSGQKQFCDACFTGRYRVSRDIIASTLGEPLVDA